MVTDELHEIGVASVLAENGVIVTNRMEGVCAVHGPCIP